MTLTTLALRNALFRNSTRSFLTIAGTMCAALAFITLRTILAAWYGNSEQSASDRVVSRNAISITQSLPLNYAAKIATIPGVTRVTWSNWFGGIYKDPKNFFAQFAIDPVSAIEVFNFRMVQGSKEDFIADRNSCLMGAKLADKYGFKIGDTVPLQGDIYPGEWSFKVAALVDAPNDASVANTMWFHWSRVNDGLPDRRKDQIGIVTTKIGNANDSPRVVKAIDDMFANSDNETHTETEEGFRLSFLSGSAAILGALQAVSGVILIIMALSLGNTLAMGLRERTAELGAMRAIGFLPKHIIAITVTEGALLGVIGGLLGIALSNPLLNFFGKTMEEFGFLSGLRFNLVTATITISATLLIGILAAAGPAWTAARISVVDALRRQE